MLDMRILDTMKELCVNTGRIAACLEKLVDQREGGHKPPPPPPRETAKPIPGTDQTL